MLKRAGLFIAVAGLAFGAVAGMAAASGHVIGYVVAESDYGHGKVRGAVRETRLGRQVRLPGGTWVYCRQSCSETLRVETVDFWHTPRGGGADESDEGVSVFGRPLRLHFGR